MLERWCYTWVDVFAARPLAGNQLCVFTGAEGLDDAAMANLTREIGHSETTFLQPPTLPGAEGRLRIWIPTADGAVEIPFAGHPILGSACVVAAGRTEPSTVVLETGAGRMAVAVVPQAEGVWEATMTQPLPRLVWTRESVAGLAEALGLADGDLLPGLPVEAVDNGMQTVIIPLVSPDAVARCQPEMARLRAMLGRAGLCTLVFALRDDSRIVCRVFSPFDLVREDPATGSANGPLGEYVVRHEMSPKRVLVSEQGESVGRPSHLSIALDCDADGQVRAIRVAGRVQRVGSGFFFA